MVRPVSAAAAACVLLAAAVGLVAPADVAPDEMAAAGDEADGPVQSETTAAPGLVEVPLNEQADLRSSVTQISHDIQGGRIHVQLVEGAQCAAPVFRLRFSGAALSVDAEWSLTGPGRHTAQYSLCYPRAAAESTYFLELVVLSCASSAAFLGDRATLMAACLEDPTGNVLNAPYLFRGESFYIFAMKILSKNDFSAIICFFDWTFAWSNNLEDNLYVLLLQVYVPRRAVKSRVDRGALLDCPGRRAASCAACNAISAGTFLKC